MRSALATILAFCVLCGSVGPAAAADSTLTAPERQIPDVRPFESAHFGLAGTVKLDGVTIDILGEGDLSMPDRQRSSFKFGPFTVEVVMVGDAVYTRTRFERTWSRQFVPQPVMVGPISSGEITRLERDVQLVGREAVGDVLTEHYTATLDFQRIVEPLIGAVSDADARRALQSLSGSVDVWVGSDDRMIRQERLVLSLTLPALEPQGDVVPTVVDLTIGYSRLNDPVSIEAPSRNDPTPLRSPQPGVTPVFGPAGSGTAPTGRQTAPARAPAQVPSR